MLREVCREDRNDISATQGLTRSTRAEQMYRLSTTKHFLCEKEGQGLADDPKWIKKKMSMQPVNGHQAIIGRLRPQKVSATSVSRNLKGGRATKLSSPPERYAP
jgi:hypothetical protein